MSSNNKSTPNYTNIAEIKQFWLDKIAPNYFDFDDVNNYNVGIFGFINEVMANTTENGFNAVSVARREFYPVTAKYISSLYSMAALQSIPIPLTSAATCKCALILEQDEVIENSTFVDGIGTCIIDSTLKLFANDLQFMIDYPIKILSKKTDKWSHTIHYDVNVSNSLNTSSQARYVSNKVIKENGKNYLILFIDIIRQLEMTEVTNLVIKDNMLETYTMDVDFVGNIANFEVFYKESVNSEEMQLKKILINEIAPKTPYVQYELINDNKIRLTFTYNAVFNPKYNSEIICKIYTSRGAAGNFNSFLDDLPCSSESDKYPYNANMSIVGKINGSASGGKDKPSLDEFRNTVIKAYSTNNTNTTSHDLQVYFDETSDGLLDAKVLFKKKRDDPFIRLFGAYTTMKDKATNVIPTNTLEIELLKSDLIANVEDNVNRLNIPPGSLFEYKATDSYSLIPIKGAEGNILTVLDIDSLKKANPEKLFFTNPFLIGLGVSPNNVGYYMNSINKFMSIEYLYVNDESAQQFIGGTTSIYRNGISKSNYYKIRIKLTAASDIDISTIVTMNDSTMSENKVIAKHNGRVTAEEYHYDTSSSDGFIRYTIEYDTSDQNSRIEYIQASNTLPINKKSITGYKMNYSVGERFIAGDVLATKRVDDLGNLIICGDLSYVLFANNYYIPFSIQDYDVELNAFVLEAYLATNDDIDLEEKVAITHGILNKDGSESKSLAINMKDQLLEMNVLYNNEGSNIQHKYSNYVGLNKYTLTNTYITNENDRFNFITSLQFIRSVVKFLPHGENPANFKIKVSESPVVGASWASSMTNYDYFISQYSIINKKFKDAFYALENNFSIDGKFYNTYGKARFYKVGNNEDNMQLLNSVKCKFKFGVRLNTVASTDLFIKSFRSFVKEYIEDTNNLTSSGRDVYIMNLIADIKANFKEILYLEYYGMNIYDYMAQKIVGPSLSDYWENFIPEFINLDTLIDINGVEYPNIQVDILPS